MLASYSPSDGSDYGGRRRAKHLDSTSGIGGNMRTTITTPTSVIILLVAAIALIPLADGVPDKFKFLFKNLGRDAAECNDFLESHIATCFNVTVLGDDTDAICKATGPIWHCVNKASCAECEVLSYFELLSEMQANVKSKCDPRPVEHPKVCKEDANITACRQTLTQMKLDEQCQNEVTTVRSNTSLPFPDRFCQDDFAQKYCMAQKACEYCEYRSAMLMAYDDEMKLKMDNEACSKVSHHKSICNASSTPQPDQETAIERQVCWEQLEKNNVTATCFSEADVKFKIDGLNSTRYNSCQALEYELDCFQEHACNVCMVGAISTLKWYAKQKSQLLDCIKVPNKTDMPCNPPTPPPTTPTIPPETTPHSSLPSSSATDSSDKPSSTTVGNSTDNGNHSTTVSNASSVVANSETTERDSELSSTTEKKSKTVLIIVIVIIVLLVILCLVGGYCYWQSSEEEEKKKAADSSKAPKSTSNKDKSKSKAADKSTKNAVPADKSSKAEKPKSGVDPGVKSGAGEKSGSAALKKPSGIKSTDIKSNVGPTKSATQAKGPNSADFKTVKSVVSGADGKVAPLKVKSSIAPAKVSSKVKQSTSATKVPSKVKQSASAAKVSSKVKQSTSQIKDASKIGSSISSGAVRSKSKA